MMSSPDLHEPLPVEHIKLGNHIWYEGFTSTFSWKCPAEIYKVDKKERVFFVKSYDDMREQAQPYSFDLTPHSPDSRKSMRAISEDEAMEYLRDHIVARRVVKSDYDPEFPFAVEFGVAQIVSSQPAELSTIRREFLKRWAMTNGFDVRFGISEQALFRCEDDAVLCRIAIADR